MTGIDYSTRIARISERQADDLRKQVDVVPLVPGLLLFVPTGQPSGL